jgi:ribosomal protein L27
MRKKNLKTAQRRAGAKESWGTPVRGARIIITQRNSMNNSNNNIM